MDELRELNIPRYLQNDPVCLQLNARPNCKFRDHERCRILTDTHFDRLCPFYKKKEEKRW